MGCSRAKSLGESKREKKVIEREGGGRGSGFPDRQRSNSGRRNRIRKNEGIQYLFSRF